MTSLFQKYYWKTGVFSVSQQHGMNSLSTKNFIFVLLLACLHVCGCVFSDSLLHPRSYIFYFVADDNLELSILLPLHPNCWDLSQTPEHSQTPRNATSKPGDQNRLILCIVSLLLNYLLQNPNITLCYIETDSVVVELKEP